MNLVPLTLALLQMALALDRAPLAHANLLEYSARVLRPGLAYALVEDGYLYGCGGLIPSWPGRAEAWLAVTKLAQPRHIVRGVRMARAWLEQKQREPDFARVEFFIGASQPWRENFARALDLDETPIALKAWGPDGADYFLYARVRRA